MRRVVFFILIIFVIVIIIPILVVRGFLFFSQEDREEDLIIKVYDHREEKIEPMELNDYLKGVVAAEMPAIFHLDALKAQAVAARTYTLKQLPAYGGDGSPQDPEADISTDYRFNQAWISKAEMKEKWGFISYFYFWMRISSAVEETKNEILVYDNELVDAVYHSNSGGRTENSESVWGNKTPYLVSVDSPYDKESEKNFKQVFEFNINEVDEKLGTNLKEKIDVKQNLIVSFTSTKGITDTEKLINVETYNESGSVNKIKVGDKVFTGRKVRELLSLPSTKFDLTIQENIIVCEVLGYGHGVGMSQDGANGLARHGYSYKKVLKHYYPGVKIVDIQNWED